MDPDGQEKPAAPASEGETEASAIKALPLDEILAAREAARSGDHRLAGELWKTHFATSADAIARTCLNREADQEEAVAEARSRFIAKLGGLRDAGSVRAWCTRIVINACYSVLREREGRQRRVRAEPEGADGAGEHVAGPRYVPLASVPEEAIVSPDNAAAAYEAELRAYIGARLRELVLELPPDERLLVASVLPPGERTSVTAAPGHPAPPGSLEEPSLGDLAKGDRREYERLKKARARLLRQLRERLKFTLASAGETEVLGYLREYLEGRESRA